MRDHLERVLMGLMLGIALAWTMVSVYKIRLDGVEWGSFQELWVSLVLLLGALVLVYPKLTPQCHSQNPQHPTTPNGSRSLSGVQSAPLSDESPSSDFSSVAKSPAQTIPKHRLKYGLWLGGMLAGVGLVLSWQSQMSGEQLLWEMTQQKNKAIATSEWVENVISSKEGLSCSKAQSFFLVLKENPTWPMQMEEKFWLKDLVLRLHAQGCITDPEAFALVGHLKVLPTRLPPPRTARFGLNFSQNRTQMQQQEFVDRFLGINALEWCLQKNAPSACLHEDSRAILSRPPVSFSSL